MTRKSWLFSAILVVLAVLIHFLSKSTAWVEGSYANGFYPAWASFLRILFGWLPLSLGDILYGAAFLWVVWKTIKATKALFKRQVTWQSFGKGLYKTGCIFLIIYIIFNLFWGINYNRKGVAFQLGLKMEKYSLDDLKNMNALLVDKVNNAKQNLINSKATYPSFKKLFEEVQQNYELIDSTYPFLQYNHLSLKPSVWSWLGNYVGFAGYYNPFTGEAQVNTTGPKFLHPYTACHEVAHQLGYAKEMEANFVGYLAASASKDTLFQYSVYLDLLIYSNRNLFFSDSASAHGYMKHLLPAIKTDLKQWDQFNRKHRNPMGPVIRWMYGKYLQGNQQPQGILSYDEVTSFLIAYYKKFGKI